MSKSRWLVLASICSLVAMPTISNAQASDSTKAEPQEFVRDVLRALLGPNWNLFAHAGSATAGEFLLQRANPIGGEVALRGSGGYNIGAGGGVDMFLRMGVRASYTFTSRDLDFKTDNGDGSGALDIDNVGTLMTHTVALEVMRYMLPARAAFTPYGTLGLQGTWWVLNEKSPLVTSGGASAPFSLRPLGSFGVQYKASENWGGRLEATLSSGHNPFSGKKSFRAFAGPTIDKPTGVSRTDYRLSGVYFFGKPKTPERNAPVAHK